MNKQLSLAVNSVSPTFPPEETIRSTDQLEEHAEVTRMRNLQAGLILERIASWALGWPDATGAIEKNRDL